jgi:RNA polymerase sigma-70 factor (ECF subfamily)
MEQNVNAIEFEEHRPLLFSLAYRMLGSAAEAEDVVQDTWMRATGSQADVGSPRAWLATIATRLALDRLKSARVAREEYVGTWLPEPVLTGPEANQQDAAERRETITFAFLTMLERLSPAERAAFVLREAFDFEYAEIADVLETSPANARQLVHRSRTRLAEARPRFPATRQRAVEMVERFRNALADGDVPALTQLLAEDVHFRADGGGKATAARVPLEGRDAVVRLFAGFIRIAAQMRIDTATELREVNGEPAILVWINGQLETVFSFGVDDAGIGDIRAVRNPDKLTRIARELRPA